MVAAARAQVAAADDRYREAHHAATDAGWSAAALVDMGYRAPQSSGTRTRRTRTTASRSGSVCEPVGTRTQRDSDDVDATATTAAS